MATADQVVLATMTRTEATALGLEQGLPVWVSPAPGAPTVPAATAPRIAEDDDSLLPT